MKPPSETVQDLVNIEMPLNVVHLGYLRLVSEVNAVALDGDELLFLGGCGLANWRSTTGKNEADTNGEYSHKVSCVM